LFIIVQSIESIPAALASAAAIHQTRCLSCSTRSHDFKRILLGKLLSDNAPIPAGERIMLQLKRAYEKPSRSDGQRILVERLWPRGLTKARAALDLWMKDVAPSTALRKWFSHDPAKWKQFQQRYFKELQAHGDALGELRRKSKRGRVTLIYSSHDTEHNAAVALKLFLNRKPRR
jgi:uncharacterized protein YeaO (DUF488 family)